MAAELANLETAAEDNFVHGMLENLGGKLLSWTKVYLQFLLQALIAPDPSQGRYFNSCFVIIHGELLPK